MRAGRCRQLGKGLSDGEEGQAARGTRHEAQSARRAGARGEGRLGHG